MSSDPGLQEFFEELRRRRAELRDSMAALESALAQDVDRDASRWAERVHVALVEMSADLDEHVDITEGPGGLYGDILADAPGLAAQVATMRKEHPVLRSGLDELLARMAEPDGAVDVAQVRHLGTELLGRLARHRHRGAQLVFEAYELDLGGET